MKRILRFALIAPGLLYVWALLPVSFRPQFTGSPLRERDATITVDLAVSKSSGADALRAVATTALQRPSNTKIKAACEPPGLLRPIVRPSQRVTIRFVEDGHVVAQQSFDCHSYL